MDLKIFGVLSFLLFLIVSGSLGCTPSEQEQCHLPNCLCPSLSIPAGLAAYQTPQIVYITFDDAITVTNFPMYEEILFPRLNPNGYPITATFYITHEYNDYNKTGHLWKHGNEIALHSITHQTNTEYWKTLNQTGWAQEVLDQKLMMAHFASIPEQTITGFRAPFLQTGGDTMMSVLHGGIGYDCSRPTWAFMEPGLWPYTMDFDTEFQDCQIEPCAVHSYPGFWNVPMVNLIGDNQAPCAMIDTCQPNPDTPEKVLDLLKRNFLRSYNGNRAPFGVFTHAAWLSTQFPGHKEGYVLFLDYLATLPDVFITSVEKGLEWIRNPTPLETINDFAPWQVVQQPHECTAYNCRFAPEDTPFGSERYMAACKPCPRKYPWLGNPYGDDF